MAWSVVCVFVFFFQAEDGIRDGHVTGVQTCALPICWPVIREGVLTARRQRRVKQVRWASLALAASVATVIAVQIGKSVVEGKRGGVGGGGSGEGKKKGESEKSGRGEEVDGEEAKHMS